MQSCGIQVFCLSYYTNCVTKINKSNVPIFHKYKTMTLLSTVLFRYTKDLLPTIKAIDENY